MSSSRDLLAREAGSLVGRLRTWTAVRYAAQALPGHTRADVVHHLAAELAALSGAPVRLPRLDGDLVLADQLAVAADDLVRSAPGDDVAGRPPRTCSCTARTCSTSPSPRAWPSGCLPQRAPGRRSRPVRADRSGAGTPTREPPEGSPRAGSAEN